ncbi:hypothetical protein HN371_13255 [Candidatus Poribacteria bacterium]|nr:hypothetical protein [Candidatus Poribacteria bacterium]MBT5533167.1 hypothetical protein [Candidatus Poribacteria bacterium]MBT5712829.1 hypothetical protein [Candidatus Poribacteria bacterium]MBT7100907.1 hypothetical protein [Candidatus Poribacteria bacterium]MBT7807820.1 hypothetical protein [Candidatus Poribacteria bacterium]
MGLDQFDRLGRWLVNDIGWVSIEILVLTAIVYALTKWAGVRSSRTRRWLWTLAVVKPLVTLLVAWPLAVGGGRHARIAPLQEPVIESGVDIPRLREAIPPDDFLTGAARQVAQEPGPAADTVTESPTRMTVHVAGVGGITGFAVLGAIWVIGSVGLGLYTLLGVGWLMHMRRRGTPIGVDDLAAVCEQYSDAVTDLVQRVEVRLTTRISEPCIYGLFRPVILLPTWCLEDNTPPNLEYILLHEGMHYRARDHWFLGLRRAMEVFLWFHPAVWYAGHKAMIEAENVCDEAVVNLAYRQGTASAALMYSSCLMRVLERATRHSFESLVPGVIPTAARIRRLVQQNGPFATSVSGVSVAAVAALALVALPGAGGPGSSLAQRGYDVITRKEAPVREVLFTTKYPGDYHFNLYAARSDGSGVRRITDDGAHYEEGCWSPDGTRIAAFAWRPEIEGWSSYIFDASTGEMLRPLSGTTWEPRGATWGPNSEYVIVTGKGSPRHGGTDVNRNLYEFDVRTQEYHRLTDDTVDRRDASWSPDGKTVAYIRAREGAAGHDLALMNPDGTGEQVIHHDEPEGVFQSRPAWSPDSARLAYLVHGPTVNDPHELRVLDVTSRESTVVGLLVSKVGQRRQSVAWLDGHNAVVVTDKRSGDRKKRLYRLSLSTGEMTRISTAVADARFPSAGPIAEPGPGTTPALGAPTIVGPARHPKTGHAYFAVVTARSTTGDAAEAMQFEGLVGHLATITSDEEGEFLLAESPFAHHGFWLGGWVSSVPPE